MWKTAIVKIARFLLGFSFRQYILTRFDTMVQLSGAFAQPRLVLWDVMDTLVVDPFFRGMHKSVFDCETLEQLFAEKDNSAFINFELGLIDEDECTRTYFEDRRPVDGARVRAHLRENYRWIDGMRELCTELREQGVPMALFSNYPAPWAPLVDEACALSSVVGPWAFISGKAGVRKPDPDAYRKALAAVGRAPETVLFVDDSERNVVAAREVGLAAVRFEGTDALRAVLREAYFPALAPPPPSALEEAG